MIKTSSGELIVERWYEYAVQREGFVSEVDCYEEALEERALMGGDIVRCSVMKTDWKSYDPSQEDPFITSSAG